MCAPRSRPARHGSQPRCLAWCLNQLTFRSVKIRSGASPATRWRTTPNSLLIPVRGAAAVVQVPVQGRVAVRARAQVPGAERVVAVVDNLAAVARAKWIL